MGEKLLKFDYLASPYSHEFEAVREMRFRAVEATTAYLFKQGHVVFSPIVYCHKIATKWALPKDALFWRNLNFSFLHSSKEIIVLALPGWQDSQGVKGEMEEASRLQLPIKFLWPHEVGVQDITDNILSLL